MHTQINILNRFPVKQLRQFGLAVMVQILTTNNKPDVPIATFFQQQFSCHRNFPCDLDYRLIF